MSIVDRIVARSRIDDSDDVSRRDLRLALGGIILIAVAARVASAIIQGDAVVEMPGVQDQISYDALARRVVEGYGFTFGTDWWPATHAGAPTAHWSFLYTLYLAGVYALDGMHPLLARLLQAVGAGIVFPLLAWRIGRRLFGTAVGLTAAALISVYGYFVYYAGALMTETLYIAALLWAFDIAFGIVLGPVSGADVVGRSPGSIHKPRGIWNWLQLGIALGAAVLLRQLVLLFVPFLAGWILVAAGRTRWRSMARGLIASACVVAVMILPWTVRNYAAFDRFVLLNTNAGYAFFWANHPIHGMNFISILPDETYQELIPTELRPMNEAALEAELMRRGIGFVVSDPIRYVILSASRLKDYFEFWPSGESGELSNVARVLSFGVYLPFMLYGAWRTLTNRAEVLRVGQLPALILLYLFIIVYSGIHLLSWALVRYRLPVDAVLMPFAAMGVVHLLIYVRSRRSASTSAVKSTGG